MPPRARAARARAPPRQAETEQHHVRPLAARLPKRWAAAPASGMASSAPTAIISSASPSCPSLSRSLSWISAIRGTQLP